MRLLNLTIEKKNSYTHQLEWGMTPEGIVNWLGSCKEDHPTQEEVDEESATLQAEWDSQEYARDRKAEYDALNQFELISDDDVNGTTTHKDAIAAIKAKWPKDNSGPV